MDNEKNKYLDPRSEVLGAAVSGFMGALGGPEGALIGGVVGLVVNKGVSDLLARFLSKNEQAWVRSSAEEAIIKIQERIRNGDKIRCDGYFDEIDGRSDAEEIFEGTLIKSKTQYQEKKIKYISNIFSSSVFDERLKTGDVHQLLDVIEKMTYRKICILKFCTTCVSLNVMDFDYRDYKGQPNPELAFLLQDFMDLCNLGILERLDGMTMLSVDDVCPKSMRLSNIGDVYFEAIDGKCIPVKDLKGIVDILTVKK